MIKSQSKTDKRERWVWQTFYII